MSTTRGGRRGSRRRASARGTPQAQPPQLFTQTELSAEPSLSEHNLTDTSVRQGVHQTPTPARPPSVHPSHVIPSGTPIDIHGLRQLSDLQQFRDLQQLNELDVLRAQRESATDQQREDHPLDSRTQPSAGPSTLSAHALLSPEPQQQQTPGYAEPSTVEHTSPELDPLAEESQHERQADIVDDPDAEIRALPYTSSGAQRKRRRSHQQQALAQRGQFIVPSDFTEHVRSAFPARDSEQNRRADQGETLARTSARQRGHTAQLVDDDFHRWQRSISTPITRQQPDVQHRINIRSASDHSNYSRSTGEGRAVDRGPDHDSEINIADNIVPINQESRILQSYHVALPTEPSTIPSSEPLHLTTESTPPVTHHHAVRHDVPSRSHPQQSSAPAQMQQAPQPRSRLPTYHILQHQTRSQQGEEDYLQVSSFAQYMQPSMLTHATQSEFLAVPQQPPQGPPALYFQDATLAQTTHARNIQALHHPSQTPAGVGQPGTARQPGNLWSAIADVLQRSPVNEQLSLQSQALPVQANRSYSFDTSATLSGLHVYQSPLSRDVIDFPTAPARDDSHQPRRQARQRHDDIESTPLRQQQQRHHQHSLRASEEDVVQPNPQQPWRTFAAREAAYVAAARRMQQRAGSMFVPSASIPQQAQTSSYAFQEPTIKRARSEQITAQFSGTFTEAPSSAQAGPSTLTAPTSVRGFPTGSRGRSGTRTDPDDLTGHTAAEAKAMTQEERERMLYKRKIRNRVSAAKTREKRRTTLQSLQDECDSLFTRMDHLSERVEIVTAAHESLRLRNIELESETQHLRAALARAQYLVPSSHMESTDLSAPEDQSQQQDHAIQRGHIIAQETEVGDLDQHASALGHLPEQQAVQHAPQNPPSAYHPEFMAETASPNGGSHQFEGQTGATRRLGGEATYPQETLAEQDGSSGAQVQFQLSQGGQTDQGDTTRTEHGSLDEEHRNDGRGISGEESSLPSFSNQD